MCTDIVGFMGAAGLLCLNPSVGPCGTLDGDYVIANAVQLHSCTSRVDDYLGAVLLGLLLGNRHVEAQSGAQSSVLWPRADLSSEHFTCE